VKGANDGRNLTPSLAKALAEVVGRALHRATSTPGTAGTEGAAAPDGTGSKPLIGRAAPACDRTKAYDVAVVRLAETNADWAEERVMLEDPEGLNLPVGLVKWIQYGYLLRDARIEEKASRLAAMHHDDDVTDTLSGAMGSYR
jgi:hypothetical protein